MGSALTWPYKTKVRREVNVKQGAPLAAKGRALRDTTLSR